MRYNNIRQYAPEIVLFSFVFILIFFRLGIGEIQSWDESLYLIRAKACLEFDAWFDQTKYAVGGLYSSTHPPLVIWLMAIVRSVFGEGNIAVRLVSASSAVVSILFFFLLSKRVFSRYAALFGSALLGCAQGFVYYSHRAQLDIPMFACILVSAYYAVRANESANYKFAVISGIFFAGALLAKAFQGLYFLPFIFSLPFLYSSHKKIKLISVIVGSAVVIAAPWYIYMILKYPSFYADYLNLVAAMKSGTYSKEGLTAWWYYMNQIIIDFPLLVGAIIAIPYFFVKQKNGSVKRRLSIFSVLWFVVFLVFISVFNSRMSHFVLFLFLPASLTLTALLDEFLSSTKNTRFILLFITASLIAIIWSSSELLRIGVRTGVWDLLDVKELLVNPLLYIGVVILTVPFIVDSFLDVRAKIVYSCCSLLILGAFMRLESRRDSAYIDGASAVTRILLNSSEIYSIEVYHNDYPHEAFLPQFNYYSNGWLLGWDPRRIGQTRTWQEIDTMLNRGIRPASDAAIVYTSWDSFYERTEGEKKLLERINTNLAACFRRSLHTKKYQLYWQRK